MSIEAFIDNMKMIQKTLLDFLEDESSAEEKYKNFVKIIADQRKTEDPNEFKLLLRLINNISCNHQRLQGFIEKIEKLLNHFKIDIIKNFSNSEIFELFKDNKLILLFLIHEKIIKVDEYIVSKLTIGDLFNNKYVYYFEPEF